MKVIASVEIFLGSAFIICNWLLKIGARVSEGAFALWRMLCERLSSPQPRRGVGSEDAARDSACSEVPPRAGAAGRMTRLAVQASFYLFGLWTVADGINYLHRGYWLSNPYVILAAYFWVLMLAALPALLTAADKRRPDRES